MRRMALVVIFVFFFSVGAIFVFLGYAVWKVKSFTFSGGLPSITSERIEVATTTDKSSHPEQKATSTPLTKNKNFPAVPTFKVPAVKQASVPKEIPTEIPSVVATSSQQQSFSYYIQSTAQLYSCPQESCAVLGYFERGKKLAVDYEIDLSKPWAIFKVKLAEDALKTIDGYVQTVYLGVAPPVSAVFSSVREEDVWRAVVQIECRKRGVKILGSGTVINSSGLVTTAAHVIVDAEGGVCDIVFPDDQQRARHYFKADVLDLDKTKERYEVSGLDIGFLKLRSLGSGEIFKQYPFIALPACQSDTLYDEVVHLGYAGSVSSAGGFHPIIKQKGQVTIFGDIAKVVSVISQSGSQSEYQPELIYTRDSLKYHPYLLSRVDNFYQGSSGGIVYSSKGCLLGLSVGVGTGDGRVYVLVLNPFFDNVRSVLKSYE